MEKIIGLICEMSPYLLLGFLLAGVLHAFVPSGLYSKYLSKPNFKSVLLAALMGIPLPLCSCGVIPTAMSLRREGASKGAATSFLIATPQTGIDSIIATFSLMGLPFAIIRPIAALVTALLGGQLVNLVEGEKGAGVVKSLDAVKPECSCGCGGHDDDCDDDCCCHDDHHHAADDDCCHDDHYHAAGHDCGCGCGRGETHTHASFGGKIVEALRYAFLDMMADIGKWLALGLLVAGLITVFVPDSFFDIFRDNSLASMLLVLCIAVPMYVCATGSIPIAVALMMKGLTPGAGLVLLMAGPACNMASMLVISKVMGRQTLVTYLVSIVAGAIGFGLIIDQILPVEWFISGLVAKDACCVEHQSAFAIGCSILLACLLAFALIRQKWGSRLFAQAQKQAAQESAEIQEQSKNINNSIMKQTFIIEGMNCNHCRMSAEKAIQSVAGVTAVTVDLGSKLAVVEGDAASEAICKAVEECGFTCSKQ